MLVCRLPKRKKWPTTDCEPQGKLLKAPNFSLRRRDNGHITNDPAAQF
jgi:hypothetical protein